MGLKKKKIFADFNYGPLYLLFYLLSRSTVNSHILRKIVLYAMVHIYASSCYSYIHWDLVIRRINIFLSDRLMPKGFLCMNPICFNFSLVMNVRLCICSAQCIISIWTQLSLAQFTVLQYSILFLIICYRVFFQQFFSIYELIIFICVPYINQSFQTQISSNC